MKKIKFKLLFSMCILLSLLAGCKKEHLNDDEDTYKETTESAGVPIVLGNKIQNAYTVENMLEAYKDLLAKQQTSRIYNNTNSQSLLPDLNTMQQILVANTKYVRILPRNDDDFDSLREVYDTLEFSDFPLDYDLSQIGNYYHDPTLPDSQITWQYFGIN